MDETGVLLTCRPMATGSCRAWTEVPALYAPSGAPRGQGAKGGRAMNQSRWMRSPEPAP